MWLPAFAVVLAACSATVELPTSNIQEPKYDEIQEPISELDSSAVDVKPNVAEDPFEGVDLRFNLRYWPDTDFSIRSIDLGEISSGGPPPDGNSINVWEFRAGYGLHSGLQPRARRSGLELPGCSGWLP